MYIIWEKSQHRNESDFAVEKQNQTFFEGSNIMDGLSWVKKWLTLARKNNFLFGSVLLIAFVSLEISMIVSCLVNDSYNHTWQWNIREFNEC